MSYANSTAIPADTKRRLATVETIAAIKPIPEADSIETARVRGWDVVVRKGEFQAGDTVLYIEVDAFLYLSDPRFAFLGPRGIRKDEAGHPGHVLKTAKLRGQYSQGIVFGLDDFPELAEYPAGSDVTNILNVVKWDPPLPAELAGIARGPLPGWIVKTDEERIQNLPSLLDAGGNWIATEKIDGTSMTAWVNGDDEGVSSRNLDILRGDGNSMWSMALALDLHGRLRAAGTRAVVQGELYGPGIQGNPLQVKQVSFAVFTVQIDGREVPRAGWSEWMLNMSVPVYDLTYPGNIEEALAQADGIKSVVNPERPAEGIVWRNAAAASVTVDGLQTRASWKAISNRYLMKHDR